MKKLIRIFTALTMIVGCSTVPEQSEVLRKEIGFGLENISFMSVTKHMTERTGIEIKVDKELIDLDRKVEGFVINRKVKGEDAFIPLSEALDYTKNYLYEYYFIPIKWEYRGGKVYISLDHNAEKYEDQFSSLLIGQVEVTGVAYFLDGGSIGIKLRNSVTKKVLEICIDRSMENDPETNDLYIGSINYDHPRALRIKKSSPLEKDIMKILINWKKSKKSFTDDEEGLFEVIEILKKRN